jgi:hypothetical protein
MINIIEYKKNKIIVTMVWSTIVLLRTAVSSSSRYSEARIGSANIAGRVIRRKKAAL